MLLEERSLPNSPLKGPPFPWSPPDAALKRVGGVLPQVFADQWLLVHRDLRALPRVRAVMDAVIVLFQRERALLEGAMVPVTKREKRT